MKYHMIGCCILVLGLNPAFGQESTQLPLLSGIQPNTANQVTDVDALGKEVDQDAANLENQENNQMPDNRDTPPTFKALDMQSTDNIKKTLTAPQPQQNWQWFWD